MLSKNDLSHSILRAQKTHVLSKIASSLTLDSARTENVHVKYDCLKTYNLFSTERKHTYQARLTSSLALYSASAEDSYVKQDFLQVSRSIRHAQKTHMLSKIDVKSRTLFVARRKWACQGRLP